MSESEKHVASLFDDVVEGSDSTTPAAKAHSSDSRRRVTLRVERIAVEETIAHNHVRYNLNNKYDYSVDASDPKKLIKLDAPQRPEDYEAVCRSVATRTWIDAFHPHYSVLNLNKRHLPWMKESSHLAMVKPGVSPIYRDDIEELVRTTNTGPVFSSCDRSKPSTGYFVRTDEYSLKQGLHGAGPYFGLKEIVESAITATGGHQAVNSTTTQLKFYLLPWLPDLNPFREFRVFVCNGRVTAVSQQSLYKTNAILRLAETDAERERIVANWCDHLLPFIDSTVIPRITLPSFVLDVCLLGPEPKVHGGVVDRDEPHLLRPYFIEVNQFGYQYGAGSSLFSWVEHYAVLYGLDEDSKDAVHVRYSL